MPRSGLLVPAARLDAESYIASLRHEFQTPGLPRLCFGTRYCLVVHFDFALPIALRAVAWIARRLAAILTLIARCLTNQNINQRGMDGILTFFRSVTFRAYRRRHMNSCLSPPP